MNKVILEPRENLEPLYVLKELYLDNFYAGNMFDADMIKQEIEARKRHELIAKRLLN